MSKETTPTEGAGSKEGAVIIRDGSRKWPDTTRSKQTAILDKLPYLVIF